MTYKEKNEQIKAEQESGRIKAEPNAPVVDKGDFVSAGITPDQLLMLQQMLSGNSLASLCRFFSSLFTVAALRLPSRGVCLCSQQRKRQCRAF